MLGAIPEPFTGSKPVNYSAGDSIITPGEGDQHAWLLLDGLVRQFDILDDGTQFSLNIYKQGSVFSLSWLFGGCDSNYFYEALSDIVVVRVNAQTYRTFIETHPQLALDMLKRLSRGLDGIFSRLSINSKNDAAARILNEIRLTSLRFGQVGQPVPITNSALANRTGLARETVSRTVRKLIEDDTLRKTPDGLELRAPYN